MTSLIRAFRLGLVNVDFIKQVLFKDVRAGFVVGIIALPMSISIALGSGFPPFAGLLSSLIGGLIVSFFSGSRLGIKGPASGLSALTLGSVMVLGNGNLAEGYSLTLAVIVVSGVMQVISAYAKMGNLGDFFPAATIHGMLAALGFIMVIKQLPSFFGAVPNSRDIIGLIAELPSLIASFNPVIFFIGLGCLLLLITHYYLPKQISDFLPSVVVMLLLVVPITWSLGLQKEHFYFLFGNQYHIIPEQYLVQFPHDFISTLNLPNFEKVYTVDFWFFATAFFLAGNIESLLTCKLIDQNDPWHRQSNFNRDLFAIGIGNIVCGFIGGLPIISESKRSMVNINLGAVSFASNFFHAFFLLAIVIFAQPFIRMIPVSALAAFLIYSGIKMTMPSEFSKSYRIGQEQFFVFVIVFVATIYTNVLIGVVMGTIIELMVNLRFGAKFSSLFNSNLEISKESSFKYKVLVNGPAIFSNFPWAKNSLESIPANANVTVDFTKATVVDHSFMENLNYYDAYRKKSGGNIFIEGLDYHEQVSNHPLAARRILKSEITGRQKDLELFSKQHNLDFDPRRITNLSKYSTFNLADKLHVLHQENLIKLIDNDCPVEIADVKTEIVGISKQVFTTTVLMVYNLPSTIPNFVLQKEGFQGGLFSIENSKDINFDPHPVFSYYYYLTGEDEEAIRDFFDDKIIQFFEQHKGYNLNFSEGQLLMYKRTDLLPMDEIAKMKQFASDLIQIIG